MSAQLDPHAVARAVNAADVIEALREDPDLAAQLREVLDESSDVPRWMTTAQAAEVVGCHPNTLTRAARDGRVVGAERRGMRTWVFDPTILKVLPTHVTDISTAARHGRRRQTRGMSATARAIAGLDED